MNTTQKHTFLGIPIDGSTIAGSQGVTQQPVEEIQPLLQAVLDDHGIAEFGWRQYTPYFNDGEPCVFGICDVWFLTPEDTENEEDRKHREEDPYGWEEDHHYSGKKGFAEHLTVWNHDTDRTPGSRQVPNPRHDHDRYQRCRELSNALTGGHFDTAMLAKFGDHATITITRETIRVEFYDHE